MDSCGSCRQNCPLAILQLMVKRAISNALSIVCPALDTWMMKFNSLKCVALTVSNKLSPLTISYKFCDGILTHVSKTKYLGLTLDQHLSFNKHINTIWKKASASLSFVRHNTHFCNRSIKLDAYKTYILPIMEYASFVWSSHTATNISKLEIYSHPTMY